MSGSGARWPPGPNSRGLASRLFQPAATGGHFVLFWTFVLFCTAVLFRPGSVSAQLTNSSTDAKALLALKQSVLSDPLKILNGWGITPDVCFWGGVTCGGADARVTKLNLTNFQLVGFLEDSILALTHLKVLVISGNPQFVGRIPSQIGSLTNLTRLELSGNGFIGPIPASIGTLTKLRHLDLSANRLSGPLPDSLGSLTQLTFFNLSANSLTDSIPESLWNLTETLDFDLSKNKLTGPLSSSVGKLTKTEWLSLEDNQLSGSIPPEIGNLENLLLLRLGYNNFSGSIPPELGQLRTVYSIDLRVTNLTGAIPPALFANCATLQGIALFNNSLTGPLPRTLENCAELRVIRVEFNQLSGELASQINWAKLPLLVDIRAQYNLLSGRVPRSLGLVPSLERLFLAGNRLTGPIPASLGRLKQLTTLDLSLNPLNTTLQPALATCVALTSLQLSNTQLYGSIPPAFSQLLNLADLDLSDNKLSGSIPEDLAWCCNQTVLESGVSFKFQNNHLTGSIPELLVNGTLPLANLWLFNNSLSGSLPKTFGSPGVDDEALGSFKLPDSAQMRDVRLQNNKFSGLLPAALGQAANLQYFYANGNAFNGSIPPNLFGSNLTEIDLSDNQFSGSLRSLGNRLPLLQLVDISNNKLTGGVPARFFQYPALETLILRNNTLNGPILLPNASEVNPSLSFLDLSNNQINGSLAPEIGALSGLANLILANNQISGSLPVQLGSCQKLRTLDLSNNNLTGGIPSTLGQLALLEALQLADNSLAGEIPASLGTLSSLLYLHVENNDLSGPIPAELGNLTQLLVLELSANQLSGSIPGSLSGLRFLQPSELNFSSNQLSGAIPTGNLSLAPESAFADNPSLCGKPLAPCPTPPYQLPGGAIAGIVVGSACFVAAFVLLAAYLIIRQRRFGPDGGELVLYKKLSVPLTYKDIIAATDDWGESTLLGTGGFGSVYKALLPDGETLVAIKRLNQDSSQGLKELEAEIRTLGALRHRNLVTLIGSYVSTQECLLIYEFLPGGDLESYLFGEKKVFRDWCVRHNVLLGSAKGFKYLHHDTKPNVIHRDIKPPNILLDEEMEPHVADFGLAKEIDLDEADHLSTAVSGTVGYLAPEYAQSGRLTTKSDVFAFGVVMLQVMTGKRPTDKTIGDAGLARWVSQLWMKKAALDAIDPNLIIGDSEVGQLLGALKLGLMCTSRNPDDRPTMAEVVHLLEHLDMFDSKVVGESFRSSPPANVS